MDAAFLEEYLSKLYARYADCHDGEVASYIPELSKADPNWFGIALVTVDGHVYRVGDTLQHFTIQSISKVFTYGMALQRHGMEAVQQKIGVEPSGEAFNSISLEPETGRPLNPMINAGAIATTSLIVDNGIEESVRGILATFERYVGCKLSIDEAVYRSEKATGHRNRAIAHMLMNYGVIENEPETTLDLYFKQCSILLNCRDLAIMAATLANNGINPITSVRAVESNIVPKLLSVMSSCGMYDYSGAWLYNIGLPAKSGVAGGIMAVLPGRFGLAVFSPRLDARGNSLRGIEVCKAISEGFGLHVLHSSKVTYGSVVRASYYISEIGSKRTRRPQAVRELAEVGKLALVLELCGELMFNSAEIVLKQVMEHLQQIRYLIVDLRLVSSIDTAATSMLAGLVEVFAQQNKQIFFTRTSHLPGLELRMKKLLNKGTGMPLFLHDDLDRALEWCESSLLAEFGHKSSEEIVPIRDQVICQGLDDTELAYLESLLKPKAFLKGDYICREGHEDTSLFFLISGEVSVVMPLGKAKSTRLATLSAGAAIGELAMVERTARSADVIADMDVQSMELDFDILGNDLSPVAQQVKIKLLTNLAKALADRLRMANREIRSLNR